MSSATVLTPPLHHVNLKTTRLQEMIDWYGTAVGLKPTFQYEGGAWLINDTANHRLALLTVPGLSDDPDKIAHTGIHHTAFEYADLGPGRAPRLLHAHEDGGHRAARLPGPRHDHLLLLRRPRRQLRRAPGRQLRRLEEVDRVHARRPRVRRRPRSASTSTPTSSSRLDRPARHSTRSTSGPTPASSRRTHRSISGCPERLSARTRRYRRISGTSKDGPGGSRTRARRIMRSSEGGWLAW
jgi:catechol 2,3-dioxygenase-like lactoylglutathione lyase family enzyme